MPLVGRWLLARTGGWPVSANSGSASSADRLRRPRRRPGHAKRVYSDRSRSACFDPKSGDPVRSRMHSAVRTVTIAVTAAALGAWLASVVRPVAGQAPAVYRAPRLSDGKPDLNGIWQVLNKANYDLEAHVARPRWPFAPALGPVPAPPVLALGAVGAVPPGLGVVEGGAIPYQPEALAEEGQPGTLARARSRNQVLPAGRAARDVHAVSVSDRPERQRDLLRVRVRRRGAEHLFEGSRSGGGRFLDGTVGGPLGRRHAGRRRDRIQRPDLVRSRGKLSQRRAARGRAVHANRCRQASATKPRSRIARCSRGRGKSACHSTGVWRKTRS